MFEPNPDTGAQNDKNDKEYYISLSVFRGFPTHGFFYKNGTKGGGGDNSGPAVLFSIR